MPEVTPDMRDRKTPASVNVRAHAREPVSDPTLGVVIAPVVSPVQTPRHRLVTLGDSLTHGFQSGAIFNTDLSYPMIIAWEMGWDTQFRHPHYPGTGGLPLNIEFIVRRLERAFGDKIDWWEAPLALFEIRHIMAEIEDWWERGPGKDPPRETGIKHNLAVYGWDLRDMLERTADNLKAGMQTPRDQYFDQLVEDANARAALRVLDSARDANGRALTAFEAADALGREGSVEDGTGDGIETLIVLLGANNALGSVVNLKAVWSTDPSYADLKLKSAFTVWDPLHFASEWAEVAARVKSIKARHVIFGTVPHVTIAPIARGVSRTKVRLGSRYFDYYARPWVTPESFDPADEPHLTSQEARAIDSAIDQYNEAICKSVQTAREAGLDWYVLDVAGLLDQLASRRYIEDPEARPAWWREYPLPPALTALPRKPDSRFFRSDASGRNAGGLFSLDGVHPTTIAYGVLAQEFIKVMDLAGVKFYRRDGVTVRPGPVAVDFARLVALDSLIAAPPVSLDNDLRTIAWIDQRVNAIKRMLRTVL